MNGENEVLSFFFGIATIAIALFFLFHTGEARCQNQYDVADCEWTTSPFTPTIKEAKQ